MQQIIQYKNQKPGFKQVPGVSTIQILIDRPKMQNKIVENNRKEVQSFASMKAFPNF